MSTKVFGVANILFPVADAEVKWQFPIGTKRFVMHTRGGAAVRLGTEPGVVAGSVNPYFTLKAGCSYNEDDLGIEDFNEVFYFACSTAGEVLELIIGV